MGNIGRMIYWNYSYRFMRYGRTTWIFNGWNGDVAVLNQIISMKMKNLLHLWVRDKSSERLIVLKSNFWFVSGSTSFVFMLYLPKKRKVAHAVFKFLLQMVVWLYKTFSIYVCQFNCKIRCRPHHVLQKSCDLLIYDLIG